MKKKANQCYEHAKRIDSTEYVKRKVKMYTSLFKLRETLKQTDINQLPFVVRDIILEYVFEEVQESPKEKEVQPVQSPGL